MEKKYKKYLNTLKKKGFALPAANVISSNSINAALETSVAVNAPMIIQFSNGGAQFMAGKGLNNDNQRASVLGAVAGAKHVHQLAEAYGASIICTLTTALKNYFLGLTVCLKHQKNTSKKQVNHCSAHI